MTNTQNIQRAFLKGLREIRVKDVATARVELMEVLEVRNLQSLRNYARGRVKTLDIDKAARIAAVFAKYGVRDPWGI